MDLHAHYIQVVALGRTVYGECWDLQQRIAALRLEGLVPDTLLLTEHDHVYTCGTTTDDNHLLAGADELRSLGIPVVRTDRGGDVTYHGPGQLIAYPIIDLTHYYRDLHRYLRDLEEATIRTLAAFDVKAKRLPGYTGVWTGEEKICAIGIKTSRWVTMHGLALNVTTDLSYFGRIIPCGIFEHGVTSLREVLGRSVPLGEVSDVLVRAIAEVFNARLSCVTQEGLRGFAGAHRSPVVEQSPVRERIA